MVLSELFILRRPCVGGLPSTAPSAGAPLRSSINAFLQFAIAFEPVFESFF